MKSIYIKFAQNYVPLAQNIQTKVTIEVAVNDPVINIELLMWDVTKEIKPWFEADSPIIFVQSTEILFKLEQVVATELILFIFFIKF